MKIFHQEPDKIHHRSRVTRDSTSWDKQACIHDALWRQHYITTSITNSHILSIYFELAFLQLHLVKISCKLIIIWVNYERNKKGARFFETQCRIPVDKTLSRTLGLWCLTELNGELFGWLSSVFLFNDIPGSALDLELKCCKWQTASGSLTECSSIFGHSCAEDLSYEARNFVCL